MMRNGKYQTPASLWLVFLIHGAGVGSDVIRVHYCIVLTLIVAWLAVSSSESGSVGTL